MRTCAGVSDVTPEEFAQKINAWARGTMIEAHGPPGPVPADPPAVGQPYPEHQPWDIDSRGPDRASWSYHPCRRGLGFRRATTTDRKTRGNSADSGGPAGDRARRPPRSVGRTGACGSAAKSFRRPP